MQVNHIFINMHRWWYLNGVSGCGILLGYHNNIRIGCFKTGMTPFSVVRCYGAWNNMLHIYTDVDNLILRCVRLVVKIVDIF